MSKHKNKTIDPAKVSFCFSYSEYDCYKLTTGRCTFELSDEEYILEETKCKSVWYAENRVGYCRDLLNIMKESEAFTSSTKIRGMQFSCGHISLTDGQHRSCISKMIGAASLFFDNLDQVNFPCNVCRKPKEENQKKNFFKGFFRKREKKDTFISNRSITFEELSSFTRNSQKRNPNN